MKIHYLTVLRFEGSTAVCICDCGNTVRMYKSKLLSGGKKSCGCFRSRAAKLRFTTHGAKVEGTVRKSYRSWQMMKNRCNNPNAMDYAYYGGRGIKMDPRWMDYTAFLADMGEPTDPGLSLERINGDGDYTPENCRWATKLEQARNRKYCQKHAYRGVELHTWEWAHKLGIKVGTFHQRLWKHKKNPSVFTEDMIFQKRGNKCAYLPSM